jgi:hypothetical protein
MHNCYRYRHGYFVDRLADPLSPGKPAGVHQAQMGDKEWLVLGGVGALAAGVLIATSGGRSSAANSSQPITIVNTTTV